MMASIPTDVLINDFAIRSFRDEADTDYIAARLAFRASLAMPSLWMSQQAIEKYLKCILLLNRIPGRNVKHDLNVALSLIKASKAVSLNLTRKTQMFIDHIDSFGSFRYLEVSRVAYGGDIINLDRTVWELRRFCTLSPAARLIELRQGEAPAKYQLAGGYLERVLEDSKSPARGPLLWNNAFFGKRQRKRVKMRRWLQATNAPLYLNPQILDEVLRYIYLPKAVENAYRAHKKPYP